jgi:hypothetical protein
LQGRPHLMHTRYHPRRLERFYSEGASARMTS